MKRVIFAGSLVLLLSIFSFAQKQKKQVSDPESTGEAPRAIRLDSGSSIQAELQSTVDVKRARVGDQVILKTTKAIKQGGETVVPKGAALIGRITEVRQKTKDNTVSRIGMVFDRIEGKNLSAPLSASIVSITNVQSAASIGDTVDAGLSGGSMSSGSVSRSGGPGSGGGGLLDGVASTAGGVTGSAANAVGGITNTATNTVGTVTNTAGQAVSGTAGSAARTINGIRISQSVSGSAQGSTTLSSPNNNLKLEKGVTFNPQVNEQR